MEKKIFFFFDDWDMSWVGNVPFLLLIKKIESFLIYDCKLHYECITCEDSCNVTLNDIQINTKFAHSEDEFFDFLKQMKYKIPHQYT